MEKEFKKQAIPKDLLREASGSKRDPRVRAALFRNAFKGGYSKSGGWAWLHYPADTEAYRRCRTLWVTRMPGKTLREHGSPVLSRAMLQPVDSIMNSMRARVRSVERPRLSASGRSYRGSYVLPSVVLDELSVYLLRQNYTIRRKTRRPDVPARMVGLATPAARQPDLLDRAWNFRLGIAQAERISRWLRR